MEARGAAGGPLPVTSRLPAWVLGLAPVALVAVAAALFALLGSPGLGERRGPPVEELSVERTVLNPGEIELTVRNDGPDAVRVAQMSVNDGFVPFRADDRDLGRLDATRLSVEYPWIEGEAYEIALVTSTGGTIEHSIPVAAETPAADAGFFGLMALLGVYVGVIPVAIGMLWLPFVRRIDPAWVRALIAFTIGLLLFLAIDATLEGVDVAGQGAQAFGGAGLVFIGAALAYLLLAAVEGHMRSRQERAVSRGAAGIYVASMVAVGIGLHNLGEGLAIGSAYAVGALALGATLVIGFAIHNTTEGLAIVAPVASRRPSLRRLVALGLIAGAPAILGAWIGASAYNASLAALLLGAGAGAIAQVIQVLWPSIQDDSGRSLYPLSVGGIVAGLAVLYATGLLVSV